MEEVKTPQGNVNETQTDFKALYEKAKNDLEIAKSDLAKKSEAFDKASSEVAEFKRKQKDAMTEDEKRKAEFDAIIESNKNFEIEIAKLKTEKELATNGFNAEESELLLKCNCPLDLIKPLAELKAKWLEENEKSIRAGLLKEKNISAPKGGVVSPTKEESDFAKYQKEKESKEVSGTVKL